MSFVQELKQELKPYHLLSHPFYIKWNQGLLELDTLREYAKEYYFHVKAFPRYISAAHSKCESIEDRRVLLENLMDEEGGNGYKPHEELWSDFALGLGVTPQELNQSRQSSKAGKYQRVVDTFLSASNSSYHEGLASLYAYEYQVPEVATSKIEGLKKYYGIKENSALAFFTVHQEADEIHSLECEKLMVRFNKEEKKESLIAAVKSAQSLWKFLDSFMVTSSV